MPHVDQARELLGWEPTISLKDTMRETMTYYHDHHVGRRDTGVMGFARETVLAPNRGFHPTSNSFLQSTRSGETTRQACRLLNCGLRHASR